MSTGTVTASPALLNSNNPPSKSAAFAAGCVTALIVAYLHYLIFVWTDYVLVDSLWFIAPLGGFLIGLGGALGIAGIRGSRPAGIGIILIGLVVGLLSLILCWLIMFGNSGYDDFGLFITDLLAASDIVVHFDHHHIGHELELGHVSWLAAFGFLVQPLGAMFGGMCGALVGAE